MDLNDVAEWDRDTCVAHMMLHGWVPTWAVIKTSNTNPAGNFATVMNDERWFIPSDDGAVQTGPLKLVRQSTRLNAEWSFFTDAQIFGLVQGMVAYGELHDGQPDT